MANAKPVTQVFHVRLLRPQIAAYTDGLKDSSAEPIDLKPDLPFDAALYLKPPAEKEPPWTSYLEAATADPIEGLTNITTGAVLFLTARDRKFAITFGYGHNLLDPEACEIGFGLRVAVNTVDPDLMRSVDARTIEDTTRQSRHQVSQLSPLENFGLDVTTDMLRAVTGRPLDKKFASAITGSDVLAIRRASNFEDLSTMCEEILDAYGRKDYQNRFRWIDHLESLKDSSLVAVLDGKLLAAIEDADPEDMHVAPPEIVEWDDIGEFHYSHEGKNASHGDLVVVELLDSLRDKTIDVDYLKHRYVRVTRRTDEETLDKWSLYRCLGFEATIGERRYILTGGKWYSVARDFVDEVRTYLRDIPISGLDLPSSRKDTSERTYSTEATAQDKGQRLLMDGELTVYGGGPSRIEFCDILTMQGQLVHVKKWASSGTMSHLLAQGTISAETFLSDEAFRKKARATISNLAKDFTDVVPIDKPAASQYEVTYVIIGARKQDDPLCLPFFSQLHLMQSAKRLRMLGFTPSVRLIQDS